MSAVDVAAFTNPTPLSKHLLSSRYPIFNIRPVSSQAKVTLT